MDWTARKAKREAKARLRDNRRINDAEFAYSPSTCAVGIRWNESEIFRVLVLSANCVAGERRDKWALLT